MDIQELIDSWKKSKANLRCKTVVKALTHLGFYVKDGRKAGHKVITHDDLKNFHSFGFTCGHGRNPTLKKNYPQKLINLIKQYKVELEKLQEEPND